MRNTRTARRRSAHVVHSRATPSHTVRNRESARLTRRASAAAVRRKRRRARSWDRSSSSRSEQEQSWAARGARAGARTSTSKWKAREPRAEAPTQVAEARPKAPHSACRRERAVRRKRRLEARGSPGRCRPPTAPHPVTPCAADRGASGAGALRWARSARARRCRTDSDARSFARGAGSSHMALIYRPLLNAINDAGRGPAGHV